MSGKPILVISHDVAGKRPAGPGIRYRALAGTLARDFEVTLAVPGEREEEGLPFSVWPYQRDQWSTLVRAAQRAHVIVACGDSLADFPALARLNTPLVVDGYDPHSLETLALWAGQPVPFQAARHGERLDILRRQCQAGDFFICASERQRDWWLGLLEDQGRVNPQTYGSDPSLRNLIDVVPFGLPSEPPAPDKPVVRGVWPGVGPDDWIVLWGGGLWEWLDPLTALRAVRRLADDGYEVRMVFPGTRHPNPVVPDMPMRTRTLALADELGLTGRYAFFGDWAPYEDWPGVLLEADVGLSLHPDTVEARLAFRSRVLDYAWAGLPMVVTCGDSAADLVEKHALGVTVGYGDDAAVAAALAELFRAGRPALRDAYHKRFDAARQDLTWERAAEPLVAFCHEPRLAADRTRYAVSASASAGGSGQPSPGGDLRRGAAPTGGATMVEPTVREAGAKDRPAISVIVLAWNGAAYIADCLEALLAQEHPAVEIMVVDNGSTDGTADIVAERFPQARLIRNHRNLGFSAGNNVGLKAASGELLVLLNVDTQVHAGWLAALADAFNDPSIGIAGCKLLYPDGSIQHAGGFMYGSRGDAEHLGRFAPDDGRFDMQADVEYVTGAALAIRRSALDQIGLLDEGFSPIYYEDTDLCFRAREAGWRVVYVPQAVVTHHESTTFHTETHERKFAVHQGRLRFVFKHYSLDRLLNEFGPAERAWLRTLGRTEEVMAARHVYLATILALPGILAFRRGSTEGGSSTGDLHAQDVAPCNMADTLTGLLADLRAAAIAELTVVDVPTDHEPPPLPDLTPSPEAAGFKIGSVGGDAAALRAAVLHDLEAAQTLQEQPFVSTVPVFGKLIAAIRSLWNSVSTKWYVRPIMQQQTVFNSQVVRYLDAVSGHLERLDQAMDQIGRAIDQIGLATERHDKLTGWLSNRIHLLEVRSIRHGHLVQGQLRDTVEDVRELTDLARQVAALAPSSSSLEDRNVPASLAGIDADDRADAGTG